MSELRSLGSPDAPVNNVERNSPSSCCNSAVGEVVGSVLPLVLVVDEDEVVGDGRRGKLEEMPATVMPEFSASSAPELTAP